MVGFFYYINYLFYMKKVIQLSESELINVVKRIINEADVKTILDYVKPYEQTGCVVVKKRGDYLIIDVESPNYFEHYGFEKNMGLKIKDLLRKSGFISLGVGEYAKKID